MKKEDTLKILQDKISQLDQDILVLTRIREGYMDLWEEINKCE